MSHELLTREEIFERFNAEWVVIEDPELDPQLEVVRGRVIFHSKDRDEVYQKALDLRPLHPGFLYTGKLPEDAAVIL